MTYNTHCTGCGKTVAYIKRMIIRCGTKLTNCDGLEWKGHKLIWHKFESDKSSFYECSSSYDFCGNCGEPLDDEDVKCVSESRGEFWGAPCSEMVVLGYTCHSCGHEEEN